MKPNRLITDLKDTGVLRECDGKVKLSSSFSSSLKPEIPNSSTLPDGIGTHRKYNSDNLSTEVQEFLKKYNALLEKFPDRSKEYALKSAIVVEIIEYTPNNQSGIPDGFLPIHYVILNEVISSTEAGLIYIWKKNCDPCEAVKKRLSSIHDSTLDSVGRYSVFGPKFSVHLQKDYQIFGGPTILFILNGRIKTRLLGAESLSSIKKEINRVFNA